MKEQERKITSLGPPPPSLKSCTYCNSSITISPQWLLSGCDQKRKRRRLLVNCVIVQEGSARVAIENPTISVVDNTETGTVFIGQIAKSAVNQPIYTLIEPPTTEK